MSAIENVGIIVKHLGRLRTRREQLIERRQLLGDQVTEVIAEIVRLRAALVVQKEAAKTEIIEE